MGWPDGGAQGLRTWLGLPDAKRAPGQYDLDSADHDLPSREAIRSVVIATDYRSGSTLLAEGLAGAGGYGVPREYFQRGAMDRHFARFADPSPQQYARNVMGGRTSSSGVFGVKVFWPEALIIEQLPDPVIIRLRREDVVAQAVSTWTALMTDVWRSPEPSGASAVPYDLPRLTALVAMHAHHAANWTEFLAGVSVIDVTYESLAADPTAVTESIVASLNERGLPPEGPVPRPRLARQASRHSQVLATRLTEDLLKGREP